MAMGKCEMDTSKCEMVTSKCEMTNLRRCETASCKCDTAFSKCDSTTSLLPPPALATLPQANTDGNSTVPIVLGDEETCPYTSMLGGCESQSWLQSWHHTLLTSCCCSCFQRKNHRNQYLERRSWAGKKICRCTPSF